MYFSSSLPHTHSSPAPTPPASHLMDLTFIKHHHFLHKLFEALTMRCLNSFLSHSFGSAEISLTRNITPVFLLLFVLKGGIVSRPISPPTIGIKCVFALVGRVWSWQRSFTAAAGAIYYHWSSQRNFVKLSQSHPTCAFSLLKVLIIM